MRIPRHYRQLGWQRFIVGIFLGFIGGWILFIILSSTAHEQQLKEIDELKTKIESLKKENDDLTSDEKRKNKELQQRLTVQAIEIYYVNNETYKKLDKGEKLKLEKSIKEQLSSIRNNDIETVAKNKDLIYLIENEDYTIEKDEYEITIKELVITSTLEIHIEVKQTN